MRNKFSTVKDIFTIVLLICVAYFVLRETSLKLIAMTSTASLETGEFKKLARRPIASNSRRSVHHRYWNVNCSAIVAGEKREIERAGNMMKEERVRAPLMPADSSVVTWTQNCSVYMDISGYSRYALSKVEEDFPLAYIIKVHKSSAQVDRLLRAIYQPQNVYCIHVDAKSPPEFQRAIAGLANCFDNVFVASKLEKVWYFAFPLVQSDLNCMGDLAGRPASKYPWKYMIKLCGQHFPLKTNLEIVRQMKAHDGHNDIMSFIPPPEKAWRTKNKFLMQNGSMVDTKIKKGPAPNGLRVYTGSAYYAVTRGFVEYVLTDSTARALLEWTKDTVGPEETYWATLQRAEGVPGRDGNTYEVVRNSAHYSNWASDIRRPCRGKYVRGICILTIGDLQYLRWKPQLFANKFYYEDDPVALQCLEEDLDFRTRNPQESNKLLGFPMIP